MAALKGRGQVGASVDPDILRMAFVSLAMPPMLLKDIFEAQAGRRMDEDYFEALARFNGRLFSASLAPAGME